MSPTAPSITSLSLMTPIRVAAMGGRRITQIDLQPDASTRAQIADLLELEGLRKFRFTATLKPFGKSDWELSGTLGATVIQPCAVTLEPVTTRIDEPVIRRFLANMPLPEGPEVEMPEDDTLEPLGTEIDISALAIEALSLALPAFPRTPETRTDEKGGDTTIYESRPPGADPITPGRVKPFASLAGLRDKLAQDGKKADED